MQIVVKMKVIMSPPVIAYEHALAGRGGVG
jgi:hypothetical protein